MNKQPVRYMQTDARWKSVRLPCTGGTMSIGGGGCGETSAAMLIETLTGKTCLPTETFAWACQNGYVVANQGTRYEYFKPQFAKYGLDCEMFKSVCLNAKSPVRGTVLRKLQAGYYAIALMKMGLWTSGGHYIVVWWADDKIHINDPASTAKARTNGDPDTFFAQAKYFWFIDARAYNCPQEDEDMKELYYENIADVPVWARPTVQKLIDKGILQGTDAGLHLSVDMLRMLVWNDRAGTFGA